MDKKQIAEIKKYAKYAITKDSATFPLTQRSPMMFMFQNVFVHAGYAKATDGHIIIMAKTDLPNGIFKPNGEQIANEVQHSVLKALSAVEQRAKSDSEFLLSFDMAKSIMAETKDILDSFDESKLIAEQAVPEKFMNKPRHKLVGRYVDFREKTPRVNFLYKKEFILDRYRTSQTVNYSYSDDLIIDRSIAEIFQGRVLDLDYLRKVLSTFKELKSTISIRRNDNKHNLIHFSSADANLQVMMMPVKA